jgi:hypothetical protein
MPAVVQGQDTWLVRPDGSDAHPLVATGVTGYPGYALTWAGDAAWAPSGTKLAVSFVAELSGGTDSVGGIGIIPAAGGEIEPVFVSSSEIVCCALPTYPCWSPDGSQLVFISGHHLTPDPEWENGKFEHGVELWLLDLQGPTEPARLTYNYSHEYGIDWWAEPTFTDVTEGNWALLEINACVEAGIVSGYPEGDYKPEAQVTRSQMAVFISRALAGGDSSVPDGPDTATFDDVPTDHWAYKHVEYCVANDIVQGYDPVTYGPAAAVGRDAMAVFISRAVAGGDDNVPVGPDTATFDDVPTDQWAYKYVEYCAAEGIVQGYDPVTYGPTVTVSRDQMAVFIARAFGLVG